MNKDTYVCMYTYDLLLYRLYIHVCVCVTIYITYTYVYIYIYKKLYITLFLYKDLNRPFLFRYLMCKSDKNKYLNSFLTVPINPFWWPINPFHQNSTIGLFHGYRPSRCPLHPFFALSDTNPLVCCFAIPVHSCMISIHPSWWHINPFHQYRCNSVRLSQNHMKLCFCTRIWIDLFIPLLDM